MKHVFHKAKKMLSQLDKMGLKESLFLGPGIKSRTRLSAVWNRFGARCFCKNILMAKTILPKVWLATVIFPFTNPKTRVVGILFQTDGCRWFAALERYERTRFAGTSLCRPLAVWLRRRRSLPHQGAQCVWHANDARFVRRTVAALKTSVFILTRAAFSGAQRYTAKWTGDNVASDSHMLLGVRLVNSLGISGFAFSGYDCGWFCRRCPRPTYARWVSIGAFSPAF